MSYKAEVIADNSGKFFSNRVALATRAEADAYGQALKQSWTLVTEVRTFQSAEPVNYVYRDGRLTAVQITAPPPTPVIPSDANASPLMSS